MTDKNHLLNKTLKMDALTLLNQIDNDSISALFLDPQYEGGAGKMKLGNPESRQPKRDKLSLMDDEFMGHILPLIADKIQPSGHLFLWQDKHDVASGKVTAIEGMQLVDLIIWDKQRMGMGARSRNQIEALKVFQKLPKRAKDVWTLHNIRDCHSEAKSKAKRHPHIKPYNLLSALVESVTEEGDLVCDPCAGSFILLDICQKLKRNFIGCDITLDYAS